MHDGEFVRERDTGNTGATNDYIGVHHRLFRFLPHRKQRCNEYRNV
jgi:hypothetical protein